MQAACVVLDYVEATGALRGVRMWFSRVFYPDHQQRPAPLPSLCVLTVLMVAREGYIRIEQSYSHAKDGLKPLS
jgi:hypothetical protein